MNRHIQIAAISFLLMVPIAALLYSAYRDAMQESIEHLNRRQETLASQAAVGLETFFQDKMNALEFMAHNAHLVDTDETGRQLMQLFKDTYADSITAITRVDTAGRIVYTVPYDAALVGLDISRQEHIHKSLDTREPVVSNVFKAVQGFEAIAIHVPLAGADGFAGTVGVLIPFETIAQQFIGRIRIGKHGYAYLLDREGRTLFCPMPGHTGRSVVEASRNNPSLKRLTTTMLRGQTGRGVYYDDVLRDGHADIVKKHAVYRPVRIGDTFWVIVVATPEYEGHRGHERLFQ